LEQKKDQFSNKNKKCQRPSPRKSGSNFKKTVPKVANKFVLKFHCISFFIKLTNDVPADEAKMHLKLDRLLLGQSLHNQMPAMIEKHWLPT